MNDDLVKPFDPEMLQAKLNRVLPSTLPKDAAIRWTNLLIVHESDEINQTVIDAASELANILVGGVKRRWCDFNLTMSLRSAI